VAGDERQDEGKGTEEPVYEVIGAGRLDRAEAADDQPPGQGALRDVLARAGAGIVGSVRSGRFWWQAAAMLLASLAAAVLVVAVAAGGGFSPDAAGGVYILTAAALVLVSCDAAPFLPCCPESSCSALAMQLTHHPPSP
jgi:hypothetical protein